MQSAWPLSFFVFRLIYSVIHLGHFSWCLCNALPNVHLISSETVNSACSCFEYIFPCCCCHYSTTNMTSLADVFFSRPGLNEMGWFQKYSLPEGACGRERRQSERALLQISAYAALNTSHSLITIMQKIHQGCAVKYMNDASYGADDLLKMLPQSVHALFS